MSVPAPHEQPAPIPNGHPLVVPQVIADLEALAERRRAKYGTHLQPHNGRDMLRDAYEEALDLAIYLKAALVERDSLIGELTEVKARIAGLEK